MARPKAAELTARELEVMQVFWDHGSLTAPQVRERIADSGRDLAYTTVATLIKILVTKGCLEQTNTQRPFVYQPIRSFEEISSGLIRDLVDRVFRGSREALLVQLMENQTLTPSERKLVKQFPTRGTFMSDFLDHASWCALQVTLFALAGASLYLLLQKHRPLHSPIPLLCLTVVASLSLLAVAPWPSWNWQAPATRLASIISPPLDVNPTPSIRAQPDLDLAATAELEISTDQLRQPVEHITPAPVDSPPVKINLLKNWKQGFMLVAALTASVALLRLLIAARELLARLRASKPIEDATIHAGLSRLQTQFRLSRKISLRESPRDDMPSTMGWRKPVILLPRSWHDWSITQLRAVLAHELAHVRNHDFATWIAVQVPLLLHSYHPLVRWLAHRLRWEQELSADRQAVIILGDREAYLTALAELALGQPNQGRRSGSFSLAPNSSMLLGRLKMLRQASHSTSSFKHALVLTTLLLAGLAISGLRAAPPEAPADEAAPPAQVEIASTEEPSLESDRTLGLGLQKHAERCVRYGCNHRADIVFAS